MIQKVVDFLLSILDPLLLILDILNVDFIQKVLVAVVVKNGWSSGFWSFRHDIDTVRCAIEASGDNRNVLDH